MIYEEGYIICPSRLKMNMLDLMNQKDVFLDYTFLTLEDLKRKLTFDVLPGALFKLADELKIRPEIASIYIQSLLMLNGNYDSKKGKFLYDIYTFLKDSNLIEIDELFIKNKNNRHFTFVGYSESKELDYVLSMLNKENVSVYYPSSTLNLIHHTCHMFVNIEDELAFVFRSIIDLVKNGVELSDIKICNMSSDYHFASMKYQEAYNIFLELPQASQITGTKTFNSFINLIKDGNNYEQIIEKLNNENDLVISKIISAINKYKLYDNNPKDDLRFWPYIASNIKFDAIKYDGTVDLINPSELEYYKDKYIFFMDFSVDSCNVIKDERFILDEEAVKLGIDTTNYLNQLTKNKLIADLNSNEKIIITYSNMHSFSASNPSPLIKELNMIEKKYPKDEYKIGYNKILDDIYMSKKLDDYIKLNEKNEVLFNNYYAELGYNSFDNKFSGIDIDVLKESMPKPFKLSYSDMHDYYQCPFKYYCKKILKIDTFTPSMDAMLGSYAHYILEDFETNNETFNFEESASKNFELIKEDSYANKGYTFTDRDLFYFDKMKEHIQIVIEQIKEHKKHTSLCNSLCEKKMDVELHNGDLLFKGFIDKLWYSDDKGYVAIIDYKTGKDQESLDNLEYGENLQLPVYIYLLKNDNEFKKSQIVGFYLQKINIIIPKKNGKSIIEQIYSNLNLEGYTNPSNIELIDYTRGNFLKNYKEKAGNIPDARSKIFTDEDIDKLFNIVDDKIEECYQNIIKGNFKITAKRIDKNNISCSFCSFVDCCFKTNQDIIDLERKPWMRKEDKEHADE